MGISIVSGDNEESVKSVSRTLDLPESHVRFRCSPADKQTYIKEISTAKNIVMFCGDGTNDAVALAQASIGMHVNGGTDIAQSAADAVLIRPAWAESSSSSTFLRPFIDELSSTLLGRSSTTPSRFCWPQEHFPMQGSHLSMLVWVRL